MYEKKIAALLHNRLASVTPLEFTRKDCALCLKLDIKRGTRNALRALRALLAEVGGKAAEALKGEGLFTPQEGPLLLQRGEGLQGREQRHLQGRPHRAFQEDQECCDP